jgi:alkylation response protein AidB-like acyl-CoA dehydrogenase
VRGAAVNTRPQGNNAQGEIFERIAELVPELRKEAEQCDREACFPLASITKLRERGLLMAPVPTEFGGIGFHHPAGEDLLFRLLHLLGYADLALGRIFEAHVNAIELVRRYGTTEQMQAAAKAALEGHLFALWVTDSPENKLRLSKDFVLVGEKRFCSAAGVASRAVVTAETEAGARLLLVELTPAALVVVDRGVKLSGMRATATGSVDLTGEEVPETAIIGLPGDYLREPMFSSGAWRSSAVALGGLAALIEVNRAELIARERSAQPFQCMRFGQMLIAHETGRLWLRQAITRMAAENGDDEDVVAYVNLARTAVETACLDAVRLVQRSLGLSAFMEGSVAERISRDLATYLRQPAPDEALTEAAKHYMHHPGHWS